MIKPLPLLSSQSNNHKASPLSEKTTIPMISSDQTSYPQVGSTWLEKLAGRKRKRAIQELVQGRESATQLQLLLRQPQLGSASVLAPPPNQRDQLLLNILKSFSDTLSVLTAGSDLEDLSSPPDLSPVGSACSGDHPAKKSDKRGCYKRRKNVQTWTAITPTIDDGQAWRKYGQKDIHNAKHPRAYFRCTRKFDQGCRAAKQVQLMEDDSQLYKTTYIGVHTCNRDMLKPPRVVSDSDPNWDSYNKTTGDQSATAHQEHGRRLFGLPSTGVKEEAKKPDSKNNVNIPTIDSISWPDVLSFDSSEAVSMVYSCTDTSSQSLDMDFVVYSVNFDNFDENEFL